MTSIFILTKDEEINIEQCIQSVAWSDDIVVLDSYSSDRTTEIAQDLGARVVQRKFDNWSAHQNWAVQNIEFKNPWVFYLDADEAFDDELTGELQVEPAANVAAFKVRRKDYLMGTWLKRSQFYPTWFVRYFRPEKIKYERLAHPIAIVDGNVEALAGHILHKPFSHGMHQWFDKHNRYSDFEAQELLEEVLGDIHWKPIFSKDHNERRRALKRLAYRIPCRPTILYWYLMIVRLGFLDGKAGRSYASLRHLYETMIDAKVMEAKYLKRLESEGDSQVRHTL
ncbi:Glycosyl transferase family 2 [Rubripirellula amarantea]|uniref:Glycosyl transferase family 2 n=1 Tax=Rubripirellula amarantea TaxID=2527999 RepID=A0A5C5WP78_9BACT|nr:glycosyltransferase family 2 protein [Rubripirellula amarantea]TWT52644.1 Glycosyl transferase family 2 [Rubripirellula amarantea]